MENGAVPISMAAAVRALAGELPATIRVRNLSSSVRGPHDAWGRPARSQPVLISAEVSFTQPFATTAAIDQLAEDTVHYGNLSKTILRSFSQMSEPPDFPDHLLREKYGPQVVYEENRHLITLWGVFVRIWVHLTGVLPPHAPPPQQWASAALPHLERVRFLSITVHLPKASLLGDGVSFTGCGCFEPLQNQPGDVAAAASPEQRLRVRLVKFGMQLQLHKLRVPAIIGVNGNERLSKQILLVDLDVDKYDSDQDIYVQLEKLLVKTIDKSAFETLEALGVTTANTIINNLSNLAPRSSNTHNWQIRLALEKPIALTFAECPVVEVRASGQEDYQVSMA